MNLLHKPAGAPKYCYSRPLKGSGSCAKLKDGSGNPLGPRRISNGLRRRFANFKLQVQHRAPNGIRTKMTRLPSRNMTKTFLGIHVIVLTEIKVSVMDSILCLKFDYVSTRTAAWCFRQRFARRLTFVPVTRWWRAWKGTRFE